jgi:hypothetical protein
LRLTLQDDSFFGRVTPDAAATDVEAFDADEVNNLRQKGLALDSWSAVYRAH